MEDKEEKRVKILLSTYNGEEYLETQLKSLCRQKGVKVSLAVRDDASTDSTCEILEQYMNKIPLTLLRGENIGAARSFLKLLREVEPDAEYYAYCDQDDYWQSEKLLRAVKCLEEYGDSIPALYYSDVKRVGALLEKIVDPFEKNYHTEEFGATLILTAAPGCTMVFNKALLLLLNQYEPDYLLMHDAWTLQVCAAVGGKVIYDPISCILYRQHGNNVVGGQAKMELCNGNLLLYRINKFFDFSYSPFFTALELKKGFWKYIPEKHRKLIELVINSRKSKLAKLKLIFTNKVHTSYFIYNLKFKISVILSKF